MATNEKKDEKFEVKKVAAPIKAAKATASVKVDALKTDVNEVKAEAKAPAKKAATAKKAPAKKAAAAKKTTTAAKAEAKPAVKKAETKAPAKKATTTKAAAKKTATVAAKKTATKSAITLQYADKSYTTEALEKIANDVWVYDYDKKASELKKVELYVKPSESKVYYVFNDDITGSFDI